MFADVSYGQSAPAPTSTRTPIRLLAGFPPGGGVDILARLFAEPLSEATGRTVIVENRPGAAGRLAMDLLHSAPADGSTLMIAPDATVVLYPQTVRGSAEPVFDLTPIAQTGAFAMGFAANSSLATGGLEGFAQWARAHPAEATFASAGAGGSTHLYGLLIGQALGVPLRHVPYKGAAPAIADLMAGHVASTVQPLGTMLAQARANRLVVLASSGARRSSLAPEVPTFAELGHAGFNGDLWFGVFAPPGMPAERAESLNAIFTQTMRRAQVRERMRALDLDARESSAAEFAAQVKTDWRRWSEVIKSTGFTGESE